MNRETQMTHTLKILLAVFITVLVLGGGFAGWIFYCASLAKNQNSTVKTSPQKADQTQTEANEIQTEIQKSDDLDISDLDNTADLDKIDLSGL